MENLDSSVYELLEYLQDMVENSAKMPITGKTIIDKKEFNEVIEQIMNCLPDQFKKAQWIVSEKDRILADAQNVQVDEWVEIVRRTKINLQLKNQIWKLSFSFQNSQSYVYSSILFNSFRFLPNLLRKIP